MNNHSGIALFIVAGRTGPSLVAAKALPFAELERVKKIYLFTEKEGFDVPKSSYITIPGWIRTIRPVFIGKIIRLVFEPLQLLYYALKLKPDIVNGIYCLPKGFNAFIISRITGTKCVNSVIGSILEIETELPFKNLWKTINLWQLKACNAITIKGITDRSYLLSNKIDPQRLFYLNGAIDIDRFSFSNKRRNTDILFVGNFYELKGPDRIIKIVHLLTDQISDLRVTMVGDGVMLDETKQLANSLGLKNVIFKGYQENTVPFFQDSKLLLMPSRSDSLPTSMLEAMSCGCVPVISDVGNVKEAALHDINSKVIADYTDVKGFAHAISELLKNEKMRTKFAFAARKTVEANYSVKAQSFLAEKIINYLIV